MLGQFFGRQRREGSGIRWHVRVGDVVRGPYSPEEMAKAFEAGLIADESLIKQDSWDEWIACGDVLKAVASRGTHTHLKPLKAVRAKRVDLLGKDGCDVLIHDHENLVKATAANLSQTGIFIATKKPTFPLGTDVVVTVKARGVLPPFNVKGRVVRFTNDPKFPIGYGVRFAEVPKELQTLGDSEGA